jgi:uncharacterized damage-inducible protein DinB
MTRIEYLLTEFEHETTTARTHLERLPAAKLEWRPHAKSSTAGGLSSHIVDCVRWVDPIFSADELDLDARPNTPFNATSASGLLEAFDLAVANGRQAMLRSADTNATQLWRLKMRGKLWFERARETVFRDMTLSHLIHHRGQLSVYLRLLEVPVPGSYGPTADDQR